MRVEVRKTAVGTEYWDNGEKRTVFVPAGKEPDFEVTENPKSMVFGVDLATGKDMTSVDGKVNENPFGVNDGEMDYPLSEMTIKDLKELAAEKSIDLPSEVRKQKDIAQYIFVNWTTDEELEADE